MSSKQKFKRKKIEFDLREQEAPPSEKYSEDFEDDEGEDESFASDLTSRASSAYPAFSDDENEAEEGLQPVPSEIVATSSPDAEQFPYKDRGFKKLESEYDKLINDFESAKDLGVSLEEVKAFFDDMWNAIEKSHANEMELLKQDKSLTIDLCVTEAKTRNIIKIAEDDPEMVKKLAEQLEMAWQMVDIGEEQEKKSQAKVDQLKDDIFNLNRNISIAANLEGQEHLGDLLRAKRQLTQERDSLDKDSSVLRTKLQQIKDTRALQVDRRAQFLEMIKNSDEELKLQEEAVERETLRKELLLEQIENAIHNVELRQEQVTNLTRALDETIDKASKLEFAVKEQKAMNTNATRDIELTIERNEKLRKEFDMQMVKLDKTFAEVNRRSKELEFQKSEVQRLKQESQATSLTRESNRAICGALYRLMETMEKDRDELKSQVSIFERELELAQKKMGEDRKHVEHLDRERSKLNQQIHRANMMNVARDNQATVHSIAIHNLQVEMHGLDKEIGDQTDVVTQIEKETETYVREVASLGNFVALHLEEIKAMDHAIHDYRKELLGVELELKRQQQAHEAAVLEKLGAEKTLRALFLEIQQAKSKTRHMNFEVNALKNQVTDTELLVAKETAREDRIGQEKRFYTEEAERLGAMAQEVEEERTSLEKERKVLHKTCAQLEDNIGKRRTATKLTEHKFENTCKTLMLKDHEINELQEECRTRKSIIRIGAYHYKAIVEEIHDLRNQLLTVKKQQTTYRSSLEQVTMLRQEVACIENAIIMEKCMCNTLEDAMRRPNNVHRWRHMEAFAPKAYDLIQKIQLVTKLLVDRNAEIDRQSLELRDKEKSLIELKQILKHAPGLETPEELQYIMAQAKSKKERLQQLEHDLKHYETQTETHRIETETLAQRYNQIKQEYFRNMRRLLMENPDSSKYNTPSRCVCNSKDASDNENEE